MHSGPLLVQASLKPSLFLHIATAVQTSSVCPQGALGWMQTELVSFDLVCASMGDASDDLNRGRRRGAWRHGKPVCVATAGLSAGAIRACASCGSEVGTRSYDLYARLIRHNGARARAKQTQHAMPIATTAIVSSQRASTKLVMVDLARTPANVGPMLQCTLSIKMICCCAAEAGGTATATFAALTVPSTFGSNEWPLKRKQKFVGT